MWGRRVLLATMVAAAALAMRHAPPFTANATQQASASSLVMVDK